MRGHDGETSSFAFLSHAHAFRIRWKPWAVGKPRNTGPCACQKVYLGKCSRTPYASSDTVANVSAVRGQAWRAPPAVVCKRNHGKSLTMRCQPHHHHHHHRPHMACRTVDLNSQFSQLYTITSLREGSTLAPSPRPTLMLCNWASVGSGCQTPSTRQETSPLTVNIISPEGCRTSSARRFPVRQRRSMIRAIWRVSQLCPDQIRLPNRVPSGRRMMR